MHDRQKTEKVKEEVAILVRVLLPDSRVDLDPLKELQGLAETAGALVVSGMIQNRPRPDSTTYMGKGKVAELKELVEFHAADVIVFDNDLSPAQTRNLEVELGIKVIDLSLIHI